VGIFGDPTLLGTGLSQWEQVGVQALGIVAMGGFSFWGAFIFLSLFNKVKPLRVSMEQELQGLNVAEHGASTELMDLTSVMEKQAQTGDLSLRAQEDPFTEVGQIAQEYNRVMGHLEENLVAKSEYLNILDNVTDGLFLLDVRGHIGPFYSKALEKIIGFENLAGESLEKILFPLVFSDVLASIKDFITLLFNPALDFQTVHRLNPLGKVEIFLDMGNGEIKSKYVQFQFKRILDGNLVVRLMVIVKDISTEVDLENRMREAKKDKDNEMALFYRFIHLDPQLLQEFVDHLVQRLEEMNGILQSGQNAPKEVLRQLMRLAHGIKGEAAFFELDMITEMAHDFEDKASSLLRKSDLENKDFIELTLLLGELHKTTTRMTNLLQKLTNFQQHFVESNVQASQSFAKGIKDFAKKIAKEQNKLVEVHFDESLVGLLPKNIRPKVKDILIQLTRNALVHGIESPAERLEQNKDEHGMIEIKAEDREDGVMLVFRDDGQGFPLQKLKLKALEQGIPKSEVEGWTKTDYIQFAFSEGLSTADKAGKHAGRGVGMGLVRQLSKEVGGKLMVNFKPKSFSQIRMFIPRKP